MKTKSWKILLITFLHKLSRSLVYSNISFEARVAFVFTQIAQGDFEVVLDHGFKLS